MRDHHTEATAVAQEVLDLEILVGHHEDVGVEPRAVDRGEAGVVQRLDVDAPDLGANLRSQAANFDHRFFLPHVFIASYTPRSTWP